MLYSNSIQIWLKCVDKGSINSLLALVQIMVFVEGNAMENVIWNVEAILFRPLYINA